MSRITRRENPAVTVPALACALAFLLPLAPAAARCDVVVSPWGPAQETWYDPPNPPINLHPDERGDATVHLGCAASTFHGNWDSATHTLTIDGLGDVTLSGYTAIRVPGGPGNDPPPDLLAHEYGHDELFRWEYEQRARQKMEDALNGFIGMKFVGAGSTDAQRDQDARDQATAELDRRVGRACDAIQQQMQEISDKYDMLTDHGTSQTVNTAQGVAATKAEQPKAPPAGGEGETPDDDKQNSRMDDPQQAFFDASSQRLHFPIGQPIDGAFTPLDPIVGRGRFEIEPMVVIGAQEDSTVLLSDARFRIRDVLNFDPLLDGFLLQVAYLPARPGRHPDMIQAYLDVPPAFAHGVNNTIGSPFLEAMQAADGANETTMVWIYPSAPMFDAGARGICIVPPSGVPYTMTVGIVGPRTVSVGDARESAWFEHPRPNPFSGECRFRFHVPAVERVSAQVFDVKGARVRTLVAGRREAGWVIAAWDGRGNDGRLAGPGLYFLRVTAGGRQAVSRIVLLK